MQNYVKEFKGKCLTCSEYSICAKGDSTTRGYRCTHHQRPMAMDEHCSNYDFAAARSNATIDEAVKWREKKGYNPSPDKGHWYVTTEICEILGYDPDNDYTRNFEFMVETYMSQTDSRKEAMMEYEIYGPEIAEALDAAFQNPASRIGTVKFAKEVLEEEYLRRINELLAQGEYECAILIYTQMLDMLAQRYNVFLEDLGFNAEDVKEAEDFPRARA